MKFDELCSAGRQIYGRHIPVHSVGITASVMETELALPVGVIVREKVLHFSDSKLLKNLLAVAVHQQSMLQGSMLRLVRPTCSTLKHIVLIKSKITN